MDGPPTFPDRHPVPIACTLGPGDGRDRLLRWQQLCRRAQPVGHVRVGQVELRFPPARGVAAQLRELAAAEAQCCSFVSWDVRDIDGQPVLTVSAPAGSPAAVEPIVAMFELLRAQPG